MLTLIMVTPIYAAVLALFFVALSVRTLLMRRKFKVGIGNGENEEMLRAIRVHSNFAEYCPLALMLCLMMELLGANNLLLHFVCLCLLGGRLIHAYGVSQVAENYRFRVTGMALTFTSICSSALLILYLVLI